jgi:hypothetical protein
MRHPALPALPALPHLGNDLRGWGAQQVRDQLQLVHNIPVPAAAAAAVVTHHRHATIIRTQKDLLVGQPHLSGWGRSTTHQNLPLQLMMLLTAI